VTKQLFVALLGVLFVVGVDAQPLKAQITTLDCNVREVGGACIYNRQHLSQLAVAKDMRRGVLLVEITTSCKGCGGLHYLVRLFDRNGNYLTHFVSRSFFEMMGYQEGAQVGRRQLEFPINVRDLRDAEYVEFGFMPNLK
jgi:hypothetical protein